MIGNSSSIEDCLVKDNVRNDRVDAINDSAAKAIRDDVDQRNLTVDKTRWQAFDVLANVKSELVCSNPLV